jgi:hypothetical protein
MNPAIAAAFQICMSAQHVVIADGKADTIGFLPGYERCGDILAEYTSEKAADDAILDAIQNAEVRKTYERAVKALPK